jgi:hypothetical protein
MEQFCCEHMVQILFRPLFGLEQILDIKVGIAGKQTAVTQRMCVYTLS